MNKIYLSVKKNQLLRKDFKEKQKVFLEECYKQCLVWDMKNFIIWDHENPIRRMEWGKSYGPDNFHLLKTRWEGRYSTYVTLQVQLEFCITCIWEKIIVVPVPEKDKLTSTWILTLDTIALTGILSIIMKYNRDYYTTELVDLLREQFTIRQAR